VKAEMNRQAKQYIRQNKAKNRVATIVTALSVLVALVTTYILMLPGITMEYGMVCGLEEHKHTEACYTQQTVCGEEEREAVTLQTIRMACGFEPHVHSGACLNASGERACGIADEIYHTHNDFCYDEEGHLLCTLPSNPRHSHSDSCYQQETRLICQLEENTGHAHTDACITRSVAEEPACGLEVSDGHVHGEGCYSDVLTCTLDESTGHSHEETCSQTESTLICTQEEAPAHVHSDACLNELGETSCGLEEGQGGHTHDETCYTQTTTIICGMEEGQGAHAHEGACYTAQLVCTINEGEGAHAHEDSCYQVTEDITCGKEAGQGAHAHNEACYTTEEALICDRLHEHSSGCFQRDGSGNDCAVCGMEEVQAHNHSQACQQVTTETVEGHAHTEACKNSVLTCQVSEHTHTDECYPKEEVVVTATPEVGSDPTATPEVSNDPTVTPEAGTEPTMTPEAGTDPTATPEAGTDPTATPEVSNDPTVTPEAGIEPTATPEVDSEPTATPEAGSEPTATPEASTEPTATPEAGTDPTATPEVGSEPTATPETGSEPTATPEVSTEPTATPEASTEPTATPEAGTEPTATPEVGTEPTATPEAGSEPTATPEAGSEPTATPEVGTEPTATPEVSTEPTATPEVEAIYLCGIPEHHHSAECVNEAGDLLCGYADDHLHGELCLEDLTNAVFYCGTEEHLHGYLCFGENFTLLCGIEPEHRHSYECLEDPAAIHYYCGMEEHFHGELCYDENWSLTCQQPEHFHGADCRYACGKQEHTHSTTPAGGVMMLSLEESYGCYDADGNLICSLEEHVHSEACSASAQGPQEDQSATLDDADEESTAQDPTDFGQYIKENGISVNTKDGYFTIYDPEKSQYATAIDIQFLVPESVLQGETPVLDFRYDLPKEVQITDSGLLNIEIPISNLSNKQMGYFTITDNGDGTYCLNIHFDQLTNSDTCEGNLFFECAIDASATQNDGSIRVEFEDHVDFTVDAGDIKRDEGETALYSLKTQKVPMGEKAYDPMNNTLSYQVTVTSKGTPGDIVLTDVLGLPQGVEIESQTITSVTLDGVTVPEKTDGADGYTFAANGNQMDITLPGVAQGGTVSTYVVTYTVQLKDLGYQNLNLWLNNKATAVAGKDTPNQVKDDAEHKENIIQTMLEKSGSYDKDSDRLKWTIVFNADGRDVAGLKLRDQMLDGLPADDNSIIIEPMNGGVQIVRDESDQTVAEIQFSQLEGQPNTTKYTITYETEPQKDFAGYYSETNKVTLLNPEDEPVTDTEYRVDNIFRENQKVTKEVGTPEQNSEQMTLDWTVTIPIPGDGLSDSIVCSDNMTNKSRHYMTYSQLTALLSQLDGMLAADPAATVKAYTPPIDDYAYADPIRIADLNDATHGNMIFNEFKFTLDAQSEKWEEYKGKDFVLTYQSTAVTKDLANTTYFANSINVGSTNDYAQAVYVPNLSNPVSKCCGDAQDHSSECTYRHQQNPFSWSINVFQQDDYEQIVIEDTLPDPANVQLTEIQLGRSKLIFTPPADGSADQDVQLTLQKGDDLGGLDVTGIYHPSTGKITVTIKPDSDESTATDATHYGKNQNLQLKVVARQIGDLPQEGTEKEYNHKNTVSVYVNSQSEPYGSDEFTYKNKLNTPKRLSKMNMDWQEGTNGVTTSTTYNPNNFGWIVRVKPETVYDEVVVTDTLPQEFPEKLTLTTIYVGNSAITPTTNSDGTIDFSLLMHPNEAGLSIEPAYDAQTRQLTITLSPEEGANAADLSGLAKELNIRYYFTIREDLLPTEDQTPVSLKYQNTVSADFIKDEVPITSTATQTQQLELAYIPPLTKYGWIFNGPQSEGSSSVTNATGQVLWKVKVYQHQDYESLTITDTLPEGIIEPDFDYANGVVSIDNTNYWFQVDEWSADRSQCTLKLVDLYSSDVFSGYSATYNAATGEITITLDGEYWRGKNLMGKGKEIWLSYYCRVTDENMPNHQDGQYRKELGEVTNSATLSSNEGHLGHDEQTQTVTIEQTKPYIETLTKNAPIYDQSERTLHYQVDINPSQVDLDPEKNSITVVDKASYSQSNPKVPIAGTEIEANRKLTLLPETVKLYYADYDANGQPLMENGNLVIGQEVDISQWQFIYTEDDSQDWASRTMKLVVPDACALVLVYDYRVSMSPQHNNVALDITNTVDIENDDNQGKSNTTSSDIKWVSSGAGGIIVNRSMVLMKHDASNQVYGLEGVTFKLSAYKDGSWQVIHEELVTNADGEIILEPPTTDTAEGGLAYDTLYCIEETATITGYDMPSPAPRRYFYWSKEKNPVVAHPDDVVMDQVPNLEEQADILYVENKRQATTQNVQKLWEYSDGSQVESKYLPSSVTAVLRRYAIPADKWTELLNKHGDKINGENENLDDQNTMVTIRIVDGNKQNSVSQTVTAKVGSTLRFDVCVKLNGMHTNTNGGGQFIPYINGYTAQEDDRDGMDWYTFTIPAVTADMTLTGGFRHVSGGYEWNGDLASRLEITNIKAEVSMPPDHSNYVSDLQQYIDRDYSDTIKLNAAGNWKGMWENLPLEGEDPVLGRVHYKYYVTETPGSGFSNIITGYSSDTGGNFVITNRRDGSRTLQTNLRVQKEWYDEGGSQYIYQGINDEGYELWSIEETQYAYRNEIWYTVSSDGNYQEFVGDTSHLPLPAVRIRLLRKNLLVEDAFWEPYIYSVSDYTVINSGTGWIYNFVDLPMARYDQNNDLKESYAYFIEELDQGNFTVELVPSDSVTDNGKVFEVIKVKNAAIRNIGFEVEKQWAEGETPARSVTLALTRWIVTKDGYVKDDTFADEAAGKWQTEIELPVNGTDWRYQWTGLPNGVTIDSGTISYSYMVTETAVNGVPMEQAPYEVTYSHTDGRAPADGKLVITNKRASNETEMQVDKVWKDTDGNAMTDVPVSSVQLTLKRMIGSTGAIDEEFSRSVELTADNEWHATVDQLEKYATDADGQLTEAYVYYFVEDVPDGFTVSYSNSDDGIHFEAAADSSVTITNTQRTQLAVKKSWAGGTPQVDSITFQLWQSAVEIVICPGCGEMDVLHSECEFCGDYKCIPEDHGSCELCGDPQCVGSHGVGVCVAEPVEMVKISLDLYTPDTSSGTLVHAYERTLGEIEVPKGSIITWKWQYYSATWDKPEVNDQSFSYEGGEIHYSYEQPNSGVPEFLYTFEFVAGSSGSIIWKKEQGYHGTNGTWTQLEATVSSASAYSLRSTSRSGGVSLPEDAVLYDEYTIKATDGWQKTIYDLPRMSPDGKYRYRYYVVENAVDGYIVSYENNGAAPGGEAIEITNTKDQTYEPPATIALTVKKIWQDANGEEMTDKPTNYTVNYEVWAKGEDGSGDVRIITDGQLSQANTWEAAHTLPSGKTYYVKEISITSGGIGMQNLYITTYTVEGTGTAVELPEDASLSGDGALIITNKLKPTYVLPQTGGMGTHLYTGAGALLICMALTLLYKNHHRKRRANES